MHNETRWIDSHAHLTMFEAEEIGAVLDETAVFGPAFLDFTRDLARRSYVSWGEVLRAAIALGPVHQQADRDHCR